MPLTNNAFLNVILPVACKDDILMHSLLALGSAYMLCDRDRTLPGLQQVRDSMLKHYIWTIHQVRKELASFDDQDYVRTVRLVFVLTLLCHVEVWLHFAFFSSILGFMRLDLGPPLLTLIFIAKMISGEKNGFIFQRLNASSQLMSNVMLHGLNTFQDRTEVGLVLELHSYLIIVNNLTPRATVPDRTLKSGDASAIVQTLGLYETCGVMYGGYQELFALIPQVSDIFSRRLVEEATILDTPSPDLIHDVNNHARRLSAWHLDESVFGPPTSVRARDQIMMAGAHRHGVRIYLHAARTGSSILDDSTARSMRDSSDAIVGLFKTLDDQSWTCNSLWTILMAGSCLADIDRQPDLARLLRNSRYRMDHLIRSVEILEYL